MSENVVTRLRERIAEMNHDSSLQLHVRIGELGRLLDIVEEMAEVEPVDWHGERACLYCRVNIEDGDDHAPDCPHRRARELCGMERSDEG